MANGTQEIRKRLEVVESKELSSAEVEKVEKALGCLEQSVDLEASARYTGALQRCRIIHSGHDLFHLVLVYALSDFSLRMTGLWATVMEWGSLSKNGVRKRLRNCRTWLGTLNGLLLLSGKVAMPQKSPYRYRLIDVSNVSQPGSHKIDWRLHLDFGWSGPGIQGAQLTDGSVGESLTHWQFQPKDVVLADRVYGVPRSLGVLLGARAFFIIRIGWQALPLQDRQGQPFSICDWLRVQSTDPAATPAQAQVWVNTPQGRFPVRLCARAIPPEKAEKARQRMRTEAKHKKHRLDERSLLAVGFVMVISNLPEANWTAAQILALYRFRWQIELVFKRLKGLLCFDHLRARDPQLAQVYLLTKILVALLLGQAEWRLALAAADSWQDENHPLSPWRVSQLVLEVFRQSVCGRLTWEKILDHLPELGRYLCDDPRRRKRQLSYLFDLGLVCGF